tara:strand:+ start:47 stop:460 length:414 start_codon:yes stop_codon:yes gene_type:complete
MKKSQTKTNWINKLKIDFEGEFDYWYDRYINSTNCEKCGKEYKDSRDRQLDHDHNTDKPRNILCHKCNHITDLQIQKDNTSGEKFISKWNSKRYTQGFKYCFRIKRDGKLVVEKTSVDLKKLVLIRDNFIKENPQYF